MKTYIFIIISLVTLVLSSCGPKLVNSDLYLQREELIAERDWRLEEIHTLLNELDSIRDNTDFSNELEFTHYKSMHEFYMSNINDFQQKVDKLNDQITEIEIKIYSK